MHKQAIRIRRVLIILALFLLGLSSVEAMAESPGLICSSAEAVACGKQNDCTRGPVDQFNLPLFFRIDFADEVVHSLTEAGQERTSPISAVHSLDGYTTVLGSDAETGWSLIMNEQTGIMTLGIATPEEGYTIFGACVVHD